MCGRQLQAKLISFFLLSFLCFSFFSSERLVYFGTSVLLSILNNLPRFVVCIKLIQIVCILMPSPCNGHLNSILEMQKSLSFSGSVLRAKEKRSSPKLQGAPSFIALTQNVFLQLSSVWYENRSRKTYVLLHLKNRIRTVVYCRMVEMPIAYANARSPSFIMFI